MARKGEVKGMGAPSPDVADEFIQKTPPATRSKFAKILGKKRK